MGHDFINFGDRYVHLNDLHIVELRHFLLEEVKALAPGDLGLDDAAMDLLRNHFEKWEWVGPGVVLGTNLSDFVQRDDQRRKALLLLFQRTIDRLRSFGGTRHNRQNGLSGRWSSWSRCWGKCDRLRSEQSVWWEGAGGKESSSLIRICSSYSHPHGAVGAVA
jgi:hypothetical protein